MGTRMHQYIEENANAYTRGRAFSQERWAEKFALALCTEAFALEMRAELFDKVDEGYSGWAGQSDSLPGELMEKLKVHVDKGDMVDVANFAMMIWNLQPIKGEPQDAQSKTTAD